jgi:glycosyltransferase involved in cell wall biosynthesis
MKKLVIFAISNRGGGSETFLINFLTRFSKLSNYEIVCFLPKERKEYYISINQGVRFEYISSEIINNPIKRLLYENYTAKKMINQIKPDIIFIPSESIPFRWKNSRCKIITNVHSTIQTSSFKNIFTRSLRENYDYYIRKRSFKLSNYIIFVSYLSLAEIKYKFAINDEKTAVIYHGVNVDDRQYEKLNQEYEYILTVGDRYEHKNYVLMIKLFDKLIHKYNLNIKLIIIGKKKSNNTDNKLFDLVSKMNLANNILFLDNIAYSDIGKYYSNAKLYLNTSSWESFGITPLEAMSYKIPCVICKASALVEIYSDNLVYIDSKIESYDEMTEKIYRMCIDESLRKEYIDRGYKFANIMSWDNSIKKYIQFFEGIES